MQNVDRHTVVINETNVNLLFGWANEVDVPRMHSYSIDLLDSENLGIMSFAYQLKC